MIEEDEVKSKAVSKSRKRKAPEKLGGSKKKKRRAKATEDIADDGHKEKNEKPILDEDIAGKNSLSHVEKKDEASDEDNVEKNEETAELNFKSHSPVPCITRNDKIQESEEDVEDGEIVRTETKKHPSRSARRKAKKRQWIKAMAKLQKNNATCESESFRNWIEDQAKTKRKMVTSQVHGQQKWKKYRSDAERNEVDDQPKGLLHWKQSPQENWSFKGKKHYRRKQDDNFLKQQNQNGGMLDQSAQIVELEPNGKLEVAHEQLGENNGGVQEQSKQNCDAQKLSNPDSDEENEVVPIVIRPGHIRFEPLEKDQAVEQAQVPPVTVQWNGITSKKKGQQWGKEKRSFNPRNDYKSSNKEDTEIVNNEKEKQPDIGVDFDKLPPLTCMPKEGDLIAYRVVELSSTWTPEISGFRVGKVSWCNIGSNQLMLVPEPDYPIVSQKADDEDVQLHNSIYNEDGSLEIDFASLLDARILKNGNSVPANETLCQSNEGSLGIEHTAQAVSPGSNDKKTAEPSPENGGVDIWEQLGQALSAKKEQLSSENRWGKTPKKVQPPPENGWGTNAKKVQVSSPRSGCWGKKARKLQSSQDNALGKQNSSGGKPWSYKGLRGGGLGATMAILRSKQDV
ncbi:sphere organelles protein-related [Striga hermonthica]|uniref:Sphere organelles protein-related n=1 Tax=Striga hermonthica TaxID=68872 RepID=A0A9N7RJU4_STRHE|nr:sphere organelles protein-related [Striga hermonthica]